MQYSTILITALAALSTGVSGLAIPKLFSRDKCLSELPQYQALKANQSTAFGYQLAGSAKDQDELDETCSELNNGAYAKWGQEDLLVDNIKRPICNAKTSSPNATLTLPRLAHANTLTFTTLLLNAFPSTNTSTWSYLCDNLRYVQLDGFLLNSDTILTAICAATESAPNPQPFTPSAGVNETAVKAFRDASARLYAYISASAANSSGSLNLACAHAPAHKAAWSTLLMNATAVEETLCSVTQPLSVDDAKAKITEWTSRVFAVVLANISNAVGYRAFLCEALSCEGMTDVGMDGELVRGVVCPAGQS